MANMDPHSALSDQLLFCPTITVRWNEVFQDILTTRKLPDWPQLRRNTVIPLYLGRVCVWLLCELWRLKEHDEVLMPAYNCGTEIDPFKAYGAQVTFYRVDQNAVIDLEDIKKRCTDKTRILYVTHYFGWTQQLAPLRQWCDEKNLKLVEDCAMSLFCRNAEGHLGTISDAALFSFRKTLPVPDGAALTLRDSVDLEKLSLRLPSPQINIRNLRPFVKTTIFNLLNKCRMYPTVQRRKIKSLLNENSTAKSPSHNQPDMPRDYYFDKNIKNWSISRIACGMLHRTKPETVIDKRRRNYLTLLNELTDVPNAVPLYPDLPEGVCPLGFLLKVTRRSYLVKALRAFGINAYPWWQGYHQSFDWNDFPEACQLKDNILYLPVNQNLNENHMHYITTCVKAL